VRRSLAAPSLKINIGLKNLGFKIFSSAKTSELSQKTIRSYGSNVFYLLCLLCNLIRIVDVIGGVAGWKKLRAESGKLFDKQQQISNRHITWVLKFLRLFRVFLK